jgi:hypothetical protein
MERVRQGLRLRGFDNPVSKRKNGGGKSLKFFESDVCDTKRLIPKICRRNVQWATFTKEQS